MKKRLTLVNLANESDIEKGAIFPNMPELGHLYLSQWLQEKGFVIDCHDEHVSGLYSPRENDLVGVSLYGLENNKKLRRLENWVSLIGCKTVLGGSSVGRDVFEKPNFVEYMVSGTGYSPLAQILSSNTNEKFLVGQDMIDFPLSFGGILQSYKSVALLCAFGCPFDCSFCLSGSLGRYRVRHRDFVLHELEQVLDSHIRYFEFFDNILTILPYLDTLLGMIRKSGKRFGCVADVRRPNKDIIETMYSSGLTTLGLGVETLNNQSLISIQKKQTKEQILSFVEMVRTHASKLRVHAFLMYGLPYQSKDSVLWDLEKMHQLGIFSQMTHLKVIRGTGLWEEASGTKRKEYDIVLDENGIVKRTKWMTETDLSELDIIAKKNNLESIRSVWSDLL